MSELRERRWSVVGERGREGAGLDYLEAARLVRRLREEERVSGLCIVTDEAARPIPPAQPAPGNKTPTKAGHGR